MTYIQIEAIDTLFFRSGKPFALGEDNIGEAFFPPYPSVLYGAIRTAYGRVNQLSVEELIAATENLVIDRIHYIDTKKNSPIFPLPSDYVERERSTPADVRYELLKMETSLFGASQASFIGEEKLKTDFHFSPRDETSLVENAGDGLIEVRKLQKYLNNTPLPHFRNGKRWAQYIQLEPKTGIGRDAVTHTSQDGKIYRVQMMRIKNLAIRLRVRGIELENVPLLMLKLGGEGKMAEVKHYEPNPSILNLYDNKSQVLCTTFKVYLSTPAIMRRGFPDLNKATGLTHIEFTYLGGIHERSKPIGGWDLWHQCPKPMRLAMPAGSIFVFKASKPIDISALQGISISDDNNAHGFGNAFFIKLE